MTADERAVLRRYALINGRLGAMVAAGIETGGGVDVEDLLARAAASVDAQERARARSRLRQSQRVAELEQDAARMKSARRN